MADVIDFMVWAVTSLGWYLHGASAGEGDPQIDR